MMTKKHFEEIARVLDYYKDESSVTQDIASDFADIFAKENPNFNRARFLKACGVEG